MRGVVVLLVTIALWLPAIAQPPQKGDSPTREFPELKCRYTLAGKDWKWGPKSTAEMICSATNRKGWGLTLAIMKLPKAVPMTQETATEFEKGFLKTGGGQIKKHGGHLMTFQGLPCYQIEATFASGQTGVTRFFQANGYAYFLSLAGGTSRVERDPEFEKVMNGFSFTEPPVQDWTADLNKNRELARHVGEITGAVVFGAMIVGLMIWLACRRSAPDTRPADEPAHVQMLSSGQQVSRQSLELPVKSSAQRDLLEKYRRGMKSLGRGSIVLGIAQFVLGGLLFAGTHNGLFTILIGVMASANVVLGVLEFGQSEWANYAIAVWGALLLGLTVVGYAKLSNDSAGQVGGCLGFLIPGCMVYYSVKNLSMLSKARAAGHRD